MISAKLIKDLEKRGFMLEFPDYISIEDEIIDILKSRNKRLYLALPLLLIEKFDYNRIIKRLDKKLHKEFDKIIGITAKIFKLEGIDNQLPRGKFDKGDFEYYYSSFKQFIASKEKKDEEDLKESIRIRSKLNINKASSTIFAPGKLRIMNQIFNHEKLTNTELKYYYRSIRPLIHAILNENLQKYVRIIESTKKYS